MAYKYQRGPARLSGSTTYEENLTGLANISSSIQLQGGSLQLNDGVNISATGVAQMFEYQLGDGTTVINSGGEVSGSNILGTIGRIADLQFQAGGNLRATDGTVKLGDNDLTSTGDVKVNDLSGSGTLIVDGTSALNGAVTVKNGVAFTANAVDINGGAIDGTVIGAAAAAAGTFTAVSASTSISASSFTGDGAGLTGISSDKIDTTAVGATNASHYVTFANAATSQDGTDLYVNGALDLRPQSGSLLLSGSTEYKEYEQVDPGMPWVTSSFGPKLSLYGNKITEANAAYIWTGWGEMPGGGGGLQYGTTRIAGGSRSGMSQLEISGSSLTLDFSSTDNLSTLAGGVTAMANDFIIELSSTGSVGPGGIAPIFAIRSNDAIDEQYMLLKAHENFTGNQKGWVLPAFKDRIENFTAGQLTASFGPLTVNSSDNPDGEGLVINGDTSGKQYGLRVNNASASFGAGVEIHGANAHGFGQTIHANGLQINGGTSQIMGQVNFNSHAVQANAGLTASAGFTVSGAGSKLGGPVLLGNSSGDAIVVNGTTTFNADVTVTNGNNLSAFGDVTLGNADADTVNLSAGKLVATDRNVFATIRDGQNGIATSGPFCFSTGSGGDFLGFHTLGANKGVVLHRNVYMNGVGDNEEQPAQFLSFYVSSSNNGYVTRTTGQQVFNQAAGQMLSATNGVLNVGFGTGLASSSLNRLVVSSSAFNDVGSDIGVGFAANGLMFFNTSDATAKRASFTKLAEAMAGTGLTASNGQLVLSAAGPVNGLSPHANSTMVEGTNYITGSALTGNRVYATPLKASVSVGDTVRFKANGNFGGFTVTLSGSEDQTIDSQNTIEIESEEGAVELYYVSSGQWKVF